MNFTRDPIIETVITPKEGFKLQVRPSSGAGDDYQVDAVEVVAFGNAFFFRSLEKPKAFLLPISDYEIVEVKETRVVLKKASIDKPIKIAGGRKQQPKAEPKEEPKQVEEATSSEEKEEEPVKKGRKRKKSRSRKNSKPEKNEGEASTPEVVAEEGTEAAPPPRKMRALIPPPSALISESISKYKDSVTTTEEMLPEGIEGSTTGEAIEDMPKPKETPQDKEEETLEEYHPQEDETLDQGIIEDQSIDEDEK